MPGLDPAICVDPRVKPGDDDWKEFVGWAEQCEAHRISPGPA